MTTRSQRKITVRSYGDVEVDETLSAAINTSAPGVVERKRMASGDNTITVPTAGQTPTAVTIVPPSGNTNNLILKGGACDCGVQLHDTDPTSLALDSSVTTFIINAAAQTDILLYWT